MWRVINRTMLVGLMAFVSMGAACGTLPPASVAGLRRVAGTDLIGARGATPADQRKIDLTVVGLCAGGVWTRQECGQHGGGR